MTKICTKCKIEKPLNEFYKHGSGIKGVRSHCKECIKEYDKKKYGENDQYRWSKTSKIYDKIQNDPEYRKHHQEKQRRWHLKKTYGMTQSEFDSILLSQNNGCAICGRKTIQGEPRTRMVVDHCHETNKVRGILCDLCNTALGKLGDSIEILKQSIEYLKKHGKS